MDETFVEQEAAPVSKAPRGRRPGKAAMIKNLEKEILEATLLIKREKVRRDELVSEYNRLTASDNF